MIKGIGIDIIEVIRIKKLVDNYTDKTNKIFTKYEIEYCEQYKEHKYEHYAARFAAKEAFSKAIGTGFSDSFDPNDVGVVNLEIGEPKIFLTGLLKERYGNYKIHLSISHLKEYAVANVIIEE